MIPLFHDFEGETVVVVGGGSVGARKARRFAREATVVVLGERFGDRAFGSAARVRVSLAPEDATGWVEQADPALVVTATDDETLNDAFETAARERGALVNRADQRGGREAGSVVVPATVRDDPVVAALSTSGTSPALSRYLREQFEPVLSNAGAMAELTADLREELEADGVEPARRRDVLRTVVRSQEVWTALDSGGHNARTRAADVIDEIAGETT
ncbi:MAG: bifunctional precorrin-2 dehydrogenase/sirohydrochlorin ferrochelatase [Halapricum sp.]